MSWPITISDVRKALQYTASQGDEDDLQLYANAAMESVEERIGPHRGQVFSSTVSGPVHRILLDYPFEQLVVEMDGVAFTDYLPTADELNDVAIEGRFTGRRVKIVGVCPDTVPAVVEVATRELAAIWYRQANAGTAGRGGARTPAVGPWVPLGFAIPREIDEKLAPFAAHKLPGIA